MCTVDAVADVGVTFADLNAVVVGAAASVAHTTGVTNHFQLCKSLAELKAFETNGNVPAADSVRQ